MRHCPARPGMVNLPRRGVREAPPLINCCVTRVAGAHDGGFETVYQLPAPGPGAVASTRAGGARRVPDNRSAASVRGRTADGDRSGQLRAAARESRADVRRHGARQRRRGTGGGVTRHSPMILPCRGEYQWISPRFSSMSRSAVFASAGYNPRGSHSRVNVKALSSRKTRP